MIYPQGEGVPGRSSGPGAAILCTSELTTNALLQGNHGSGDVLWLSDGTRPFVIVLIPADEVRGTFGGHSTHLGVGVASRSEVERARIDWLMQANRAPTKAGKTAAPAGNPAVMVQTGDLGRGLRFSDGWSTGWSRSPGDWSLTLRRPLAE